MSESAVAGSGKPLGGKAYGHIPHLPGSRLGPGDHRCHDGQERICCERTRDRHDEVIVQEKLDGSCCAVAKVKGAIVALGRAGWLAQTSPYEQHQLFADWVRRQAARFAAILKEGERVCGEWMAQAHGTRYVLPHEPFVVFDAILPGSGKQGLARMLWDETAHRARIAELPTPTVLHRGTALPVERALALLNPAHHGAIDPIEGCVWRVQRHGTVDFLAKYVRPDKQDGCYLPEVTGQPAIWNWRP